MFTLYTYELVLRSTCMIAGVVNCSGSVIEVKQTTCYGIVAGGST